MVEYKDEQRGTWYVSFHYYAEVNGLFYRVISYHNDTNILSIKWNLKISHNF